MAPASGDDDAMDTAEATEEAVNELPEDDVEEESREAEASPSSNTRQRALAATLAAAGVSNGTRGATVRRSPRSPFRAARGARPTPIVWGESQSNRGKFVDHDKIVIYFRDFRLSQSALGLSHNISRESRILIKSGKENSI